MELLFEGGKQATQIWGKMVHACKYICVLLRKKYYTNNKADKTKLWSLQISFTIDGLRC